jgi:hypothetical protein
LFSHGLNPRTLTTLFFVSSLQGFPASILPRVSNDTPDFLASSDLLIINFSLAAFNGLLVGIFTTSLLFMHNYSYFTYHLQ